MNKNELFEKFRLLYDKIQEIEGELKRLAQHEGVPFIIAKMKEHSRDKLYLRELEQEGYFSTESLWFFGKGGRFAAKLLKLEDDRLVVVYNTLSNHEYSYESNWDYDDEDFEAEIDETLAGNLIAKIFPEVMDDYVYEYESEEDD